MPSMVDVKDVSGSGVETSFKWKYKMAGVTLDGESEYTEYSLNKRVVTQSKGGVESTFTFDFEPHNDGTMLKLIIDTKTNILSFQGDSMVLLFSSYWFLEINLNLLRKNHNNTEADKHVNPSIQNKYI